MAAKYDMMYVGATEGALDKDDIADLDDFVKGIRDVLVFVSCVKVEVRFGKTWTGTVHGWNVYPKFTVVFNTSSFSADNLYDISKRRHVNDWKVEWDSTPDGTIILKVELEV
jgi:hypothetical protein